MLWITLDLTASSLIEDLLTILSGIIHSALNVSYAAQAVAVDIWKTFRWVRHVVLFHKHNGFELFPVGLPSTMLCLHI